MSRPATGTAAPVLVLDDDPPGGALAEADCLRLLGPGGVGRLGYTAGALPEVRPVSYAVHDGVLVIPASHGSAALAALSGSVVVLAVDAWTHPATTAGPPAAWTVSVVGALHAAPASVPGPPGWEGVRHVHLRPGIVRGRLLGAGQPPPPRSGSRPVGGGDLPPGAVR